jgi:hypothetical protein
MEICTRQENKCAMLCNTNGDSGEAQHVGRVAPVTEPQAAIFRHVTAGNWHELPSVVIAAEDEQ